LSEKPRQRVVLAGGGGFGLRAVKGDDELDMPDVHAEGLRDLDGRKALPVQAERACGLVVWVAGVASGFGRGGV